MMISAAELNQYNKVKNGKKGLKCCDAHQLQNVIKHTVVWVDTSILPLFRRLWDTVAETLLDQQKVNGKPAATLLQYNPVQGIYVHNLHCL